MSMEYAIEVRDLKKKFKVYFDKGKMLKEKVIFAKRNKFEEKWVLNGISFQVKKGEAVGLIGHNGCGKSTTLKMLTKIMYPDAGEIIMNGRVSSLLELGAGFHPDMSGRENIYINASIFGLSRAEIDARIGDIIAFSELEKYIDNPVRTYSSGMYMRLAFSVAINVDADILLIDEILAVGDVNFQDKCFKKLMDIKKNGTTIVLVSHSMGQIESICDRSIWLHEGKIMAEGPAEEVDAQYLNYMMAQREAAVAKMLGLTDEGGDASDIEFLQEAKALAEGTYNAIFDPEFYYEKNQDVARQVGKDGAALLAHFLQDGMGEGRQGSAEFSFEIYRTNYPELREQFGGDKKSYYLHYLEQGKEQGMAANRYIANFKRLGIFAFYDEEGVVDDYILYLLGEMQECLDRLVVVCNGKLLPEGRDRLEKYTNDIYIRQNLGYDVAAWKSAILEYVGTEELGNYDELVLFNDSFYGPFESFAKIFAQMAGKEVDFWGLSSQDELSIQRYFTVFRKRLVTSREFSDYWNDMRDDLTCEEAVEYYENVFADQFFNMGYRWDTYVKTEDLYEDAESSISYGTFMPEYMLKQRQLPIVLKSAFIYPYEEYMENSAGEGVAECLRYIRSKTNYDECMIWQNLLRKHHLNDLKNCMKWNYVLPTDIAKYDYVAGDKKIAVVMHIYYTDLLDITLKYLKQVPGYVDIIITTSSEEKADFIAKSCNVQEITNYSVRVVENRGRDLAALLVGCKDIVDKYDYFCFTHDKKTSGDVEAYSVGNSFMQIVMENTLKSRTYIQNILGLLEENPGLGMLGVPAPLHATYFGTLMNTWTNCYPAAQELCEMLDMELNIDEKKPPFLLGTAFWARSKALKALFDYGFEYEDFDEEPLAEDGTMNHALERCFPYIAQLAGFYSGIVMTEEYAAVDMENLRYMLGGISAVLQKEISKVPQLYYSRFIKKLSKMVEIREDSLRMRLDGKFYLGENGNFSEMNIQPFEYVIEQDGSFCVNVTMEDEREAGEFRFDPMEDRYCIVKIDSVLAGDEDITEFEHNGEELEGDYQLFAHTDPNYHFVCEKAVSTIEIRGHICLLDEPMARLLSEKIVKEDAAEGE